MSARRSGSFSLILIAAVVCFAYTQTSPSLAPDSRTMPVISWVMSMNSGAFVVSRRMRDTVAFISVKILSPADYRAAHTLHPRGTHGSTLARAGSTLGRSFSHRRGVEGRASAVPLHAVRGDRLQRPLPARGQPQRPGERDRLRRACLGGARHVLSRAETVEQR